MNGVFQRGGRVFQLYMNAVSCNAVDAHIPLRSRDGAGRIPPTKKNIRTKCDTPSDRHICMGDKLRPKHYMFEVEFGTWCYVNFIHFG